MSDSRPVQAVEERRREAGRILLAVTCPFCGVEMTGYLWSLAGSGKRCACGAKIQGKQPHSLLARARQQSNNSEPQK